MTVDRETLRRLCDAASTGPWEWNRQQQLVGQPEENDLGGGPETVPRLIVETDSGYYPPYGTPNAEFIATSRTAIPALLDDLDAKDRRIADLDAYGRKMCGMHLDSLVKIDQLTAERNAHAQQIVELQMQLERAQACTEAQASACNELERELAGQFSDTNIAALGRIRDEIAELHKKAAHAAALRTPPSPHRERRRDELAEELALIDRLLASRNKLKDTK